MNKNFQYIVLGLFIFFAVIGVAAFALFGKLGGGGEEKPLADLSVWGTESAEDFKNYLSRIDARYPDLLNITYTQKSSDSFDQELIEALARGSGPDMLLLSNERFIKHLDKLYPIPYDFYSERDFKDNFIEAGEIFLGSRGVWGLPLSVNPMIMYWNRSLFSNAGFSNPPLYWDEFFTLPEKITKLDEARNITTSAIALGDYDNITNAKEIISTLLLQAGNQIIVTTDNGSFRSDLSKNSSGGSSPSESALRFYTEFSNPSKSVYSWNKSMPSSVKEFLSGDLAVYLGYANQYSILKERNPNLNFDVALMPQIRDATRATYGEVSALVILRRSPYITDAIKSASVMTTAESIADWSEVTSLPPVNRKLLSKKPKTAIGPVFYDSAVITKTWLDPNHTKTSDIFKKMVENITSGRLRISEAVSRASGELNEILR